jgi:hypothetical protein
MMVGPWFVWFGTSVREKKREEAGLRWGTYLPPCDECRKWRSEMGRRKEKGIMPIS